MTAAGSTNQLRHVIVVGGGIGGLSTIASLRSGGFSGQLSLIDAGEFPYDRPPLSKDYLAGTRSSTDIALQPPQWYADQAVRLINLTTVRALLPAEGGVLLDDGTVLHADRVVLATGGHAARPPIPGAASELIHTIRTTEDADRLRGALLPGARLLVVGAGLIGAEIASTAISLGCEVVLVDPVDLPLAAAVGPEMAYWLHAQHTARGIQTIRAGVVSLHQKASVVVAELTDGSEPRHFDVAVLGVGMVPDSSLAATAGLAVDRGVIVDPAQVTQNPAVLGVGDSTRVRQNGILLPRTEHWEAAEQDGRRAAATLLGIAPPAATAPWFWSDRHDRHVEVVGHMGAASETVLRGTFDDPSFVVFGLHEGQLTAAVSVDNPMAVRAARRIIDRGIAADRDRLADTSTDLRKLVRQ